MTCDFKSISAVDFTVTPTDNAFAPLTSGDHLVDGQRCRFTIDGDFRSVRITGAAIYAGRHEVERIK